MLCLTADQVSAISIYVRQPDSSSSVSHCSCSNRSMQAADLKPGRLGCVGASSIWLVHCAPQTKGMSVG